jgi:hypothetical protein
MARDDRALRLARRVTGLVREAVRTAYRPHADGRGKDRPVLIVGRRGEALLGLMLTSKPGGCRAGDLPAAPSPRQSATDSSRAGFRAGGRRL